MKSRSTAPIPSSAAPPDVARARTASSGRGPRELDLHGCTVDEALERVERMLNDALLADALELRVIHGRSGGRLKAALHARLRERQPGPG